MVDWSSKFSLMWTSNMRYWHNICKLIHVPTSNPVRHITDSLDNICVSVTRLIPRAFWMPGYDVICARFFFFFSHFFFLRFQFLFLRSKNINVSGCALNRTRAPRDLKACAPWNQACFQTVVMRRGLTFHLWKSVSFKCYLPVSCHKVLY